MPVVSIKARKRQLGVVLCLVICAFWLIACGNMRVQPKLAKPYDASPTFGVAARIILSQTVPIGDERTNELLYNGTLNGKLATVFPFKVTRAVLLQGQQKFNTFCTPCHGYVGNSDGVVVQRGFPAPPSLQSDTIREQSVGHYFQVMTYGRNKMFSYASRLTPEERWSVAAYLRALQLSQQADVKSLPADVQKQLQAVK